MITWQGLDDTCELELVLEVHDDGTRTYRCDRCGYLAHAGAAGGELEAAPS